MKVTVVTSFGPKGRALYGDRFCAEFDRHWPNAYRLMVYIEEPTALAAGWGVDLLTVPACSSFLHRHRENLQAQGLVPGPRWKAKDRLDRYSFRDDAYKFCRKPFAIQHAANHLFAQKTSPQILAWVDADVTCHGKDVPTSLIEDTLGDGDVAYIGRAKTHSECGFLAFRLPVASRLIDCWADYYDSDRVFNLPETHDSYVFDEARAVVGDLKYRDLSPGARGHAWMDTVLHPHLDHLKGERKTLGYSPERNRRPVRA